MIYSRTYLIIHVGYYNRSYFVLSNNYLLSGILISNLVYAVEKFLNNINLLPSY